MSNGLWISNTWRPSFEKRHSARIQVLEVEPQLSAEFRLALRFGRNDERGREIVILTKAGIQAGWEMRGARSCETTPCLRGMISARSYSPSLVELRVKTGFGPPSLPKAGGFNPVVRIS